MVSLPAKQQWSCVMRAMWMGFAAAIVIALLAGGGFALIDGSSAGKFSTSSARL